MSISPFFLELRSAYQSELDDLRFDSEGRDVLRQRLADKRGEIAFLVQMMELSPEMVAVIFHQGMAFKSPPLMDQLLGHGRDELPTWASLSEAIELTPWADALASQVLKASAGGWFLTLVAGLEYMASRPDARSLAQIGDDESDDEDDEGDNDGEQRQASLDADGDGDEDGDTLARKEAGADWLVAQGFDRKD